MDEVWKSVPGYEGLYEISNLGRVRSVPRRGRKSARIRKVKICTGYCQVALRKDNSSRYPMVHRLVVGAFIGPIPPGMEVNHIDLVKTNNELSNLEIVTPDQNIRHAIAAGHWTFGDRQKHAKLTPSCVKTIRKYRDSNVLSTRELAHLFGVSGSLVRAVSARKAWKPEYEKCSPRTPIINNMRKQPMKPKTPNKYFVGQLDKPKRGLPYRIFRQRKSMLGTIIDEVCMRNGWKRMKTGYKRVGPFLKSQAEVRADKRFWEGKGAQ